MITAATPIAASAPRMSPRRTDLELLAIRRALMKNQPQRTKRAMELRIWVTSEYTGRIASVRRPLPPAPSPSDPSLPSPLSLSGEGEANNFFSADRRLKPPLGDAP